MNQPRSEAFKHPSLGRFDSQGRAWLVRLVLLACAAIVVAVGWAFTWVALWTEQMVGML